MSSNARLSYLEYLTRYPEQYQRFSRNIDRTRSLLGHMSSQRLLDSVESLLSIGSGEGELELEIGVQRKIPISIVEPADLLRERFEENARRRAVRVASVHREPFEEYDGAERYDLVLSIHSWYAFGQREEILRKALRCVRPGGRFFLNMASAASPVADLTALSRSDGIGFTAESISSWAASAGFAHEFSMEHNPRPAALYLEEGGLTPAGRDFASFLLAESWDDLEIPRRQQIHEIMIAHTQNGAIDVCSGCLLFQV